MIKYIISLAILLISLRLSKGYVDSLKVKLDLSCELFELVSFLEGRMRISLAPSCVLIKDYNSKMLTECGFLNAVKRGDSLKAAFGAYVKQDALDTNIYQTLKALFDKLGEGDLALENGKISACRAELEKRICDLKEDFKKQKTVITTLALGFSLGFIILLL